MPECFLGRRSDHEAWLGLSPFFSSLPAEREAMRCADPLLAFDGWAKQRVYYLGTTRKVESRTMYASVMAALFGRRSTRMRDLDRDGSSDCAAHDRNNWPVPWRPVLSRHLSGAGARAGAGPGVYTREP